MTDITDKEGIQKELKKELVPVYQKRFELVCQTDPDFFKSEAGEAELLNMAIFSRYVKNLSSDKKLIVMHDISFSNSFFRESKREFLKSHAGTSWHVDAGYDNFRYLIDRFAEDVGIDKFYNAMAKISADRAPISFTGYIKNWEEMKHSQVLSAPIRAYNLNGENKAIQYIPQKKIDDYCAKHIRHVNNITLSRMAISRI